MSDSYEKLDNDEEVKQEGRSAVIRRAVADYLRKKRRATIATAYRRAYSKQPAEIRPRGQLPAKAYDRTRLDIDQWRHWTV